MEKSIMEKWVAALRSGEYKQTRNKLRSENNGFCCLGVLCNLHAQAHPEIAAKETSRFSYLGDMAVLPLQVLQWANMYSETGWNRKDDTELTQLNDGRKWNFKKIADYIEKNYKDL